MKAIRQFIFVGLTAFWCYLPFGTVPAPAIDHYVVPTNAGALYPYGAWTNAATNIQDAVNAATNGETVWITNGIYFCQGISTCIHAWQGATIYTNTAMVVITNAVTVRSVNGYPYTAVNGNWPAWTTRVFLVNYPGAVVSGLTITNGFVTANPFTLVGAGVYLRNGLLTNCLITGNVISNDTVSRRGGGVGVDTGIVSHCIIKGNKGLGSQNNAPAVFLWGSGSSGNLVITNCVIAENTLSSGSGYACYLYYGSVLMTRSVLNGNIGCSGIHSSYGVIEYCTISNNAIDGVYFNANSYVRNCLIVNNSGYGIWAGSDGGSVWSCTIANNVNRGFYAPDTPVNRAYQVENSILSGNSTGGTNNWYSTNISYTNSCLFPIAPGLNNITNAPLFVDTSAGNYRLLNTSPCVNAGINKNWMTNSVDLDGRGRIRYGIVDIGAYEMIYNGTIYSSW